MHYARIGRATTQTRPRWQMHDFGDLGRALEMVALLPWSSSVILSSTPISTIRHAHPPKSSPPCRYRTDIIISWCEHIMSNFSCPQVVAKSMLVSMHSPYLRPASSKKARKVVRNARASMQHCE